MRFLISDDSNSERLVLHNLLSKYNAEIIQTSDGFEAIQMFTMLVEQEKDIDLICLDIEMPYMNGFETLAEIRKYEKEKNLKKHPVIIITGAVSMDNILISFSSDADAFVTKGSMIEERLDNEIKNLCSIDERVQ